MGHHKILNLLNEASDSKFMTKKYNIFNDQSNGYYNVGDETIHNTKVLKSSLCDYNDAYFLVRADIITTSHNIPTPAAFKNCALFAKCFIKIDVTTIDDAEHLDLVMPMYSLVEYSSNYSDATSISWIYSTDEPTNLALY